MPDDVILGGHKFTAVEVVDLTESLTIPEHKVEDGYPVADYAFLQPAELQLNLTLLERELEVIKQLSMSREPTILLCKAGVFEDVVVKELNITQGGSINTFRAIVRVKQIIKAKAKTAQIPLAVTADESEAKGGNTATSPAQKEVLQAPEKQEGKSWLDSIFEFFGGLFGGGLNAKR